MCQGESLSKNLLGNVENIFFRLTLLSLWLFYHVRHEIYQYNQVGKKKKSLPFEKVFLLLDGSGTTEKVAMRKKV